MDHIRSLKQPLDMALYARACLVAQARHPHFEISLDEIAWICATKQDVSWRALRRQVLSAFTRICAATGARFVVQAWCSGDYAGADRLACHVGMATDTDVPRFRPKPRALVFDVGPSGASRIT